MILSSVTVSLVPSLRGGPWIYWDSPEISFAKAKAAGFDGVELFTESADALDPDVLLELLDSLELKISAVGTGAGKVLHQLYLTSPDKEVRLRAREFIHAMIDFAGPLQAPVIIGSMQGQVVEGIEHQQALAWLAEGLRDLSLHAAEKGIRVLLEPLNRYETNLINRLEDGADIVRSLDCENVFLLADLFHMNIEEESIAQAIRASSEYIGLVHFADSNRRPAGLGHIDMAAVAEALEEIGYNGYVSAEALCYPSPDRAAAQTIAAFREFFDQACQQ